jgi:hypothetical protein
MLAMQYSIELPVGYDLSLIRARVSDRSRLFTGLPGLKHKSYLLSEADMIYAPFYIWSDVEQARHFLFDDLFRGVIKTFRRPRVRSWMVLDSAYGAITLTPTFARREIDTIAPEENLEKRFQQETSEQAELASDPNFYFQVTALDAERWELTRLSLWRDEASARPTASDCVQHYEVLHAQGENAGG